MAGQIFYIKRGDTLPVLEVFLLNPDKTAFDLTEFDSVFLNVLLNDGAFFQREMEIDPDPTTGRVIYGWGASDWDDLISSPPTPLAPTAIQHTMEYEARGPAESRLTFPNDGYDILRITEDLD